MDFNMKADAKRIAELYASSSYDADMAYKVTVASQNLKQWEAMALRQAINKLIKG